MPQTSLELPSHVQYQRTHQRVLRRRLVYSRRTTHPGSLPDGNGISQFSSAFRISGSSGHFRGTLHSAVDFQGQASPTGKQNTTLPGTLGPVQRIPESGTVRPGTNKDQRAFVCTAGSAQCHADPKNNTGTPGL